MIGQQNGHELSYEQLMTRWGYCTDGEKATIGFLLRILREHCGDRRVTQRCRFGISERDFLRLQSLPRPRSDHYAEDVHQAALACNVMDYTSFNRAMEQARGLLAAYSTDQTS